jgi:hypothetical protein
LLEGQKEGYMETLRSIFTREIDPSIRTRVMRALTTRRLIQHDWVTRSGGCLMAVALNEVTRIPMRKIKNQGDPTPLAATALGLTERRVKEGYVEWDKMTERQAREFISQLKADLRAELATQKAIRFAGQNVLQRTVTRVRELVSA